MEQRSEIRTVHVRLGGNVRKRAVPIVVVKKVLSILCDIQIGVAVIIVIAPDATKTKAGSGNSRCLRNVCKCSITIVAVKSISCGNAAAVVVSDTHAGPRLFQDGRYPQISFQVRELDIGLASHVPESRS